MASFKNKKGISLVESMTALFFITVTLFAFISAINTYKQNVSGDAARKTVELVNDVLNAAVLEESNFYVAMASGDALENTLKPLKKIADAGGMPGVLGGFELRYFGEVIAKYSPPSWVPQRFDTNGKNCTGSVLPNCVAEVSFEIKYVDLADGVFSVGVDDPRFLVDYQIIPVHVFGQRKGIASVGTVQGVKSQGDQNSDGDMNDAGEGNVALARGDSGALAGEPLRLSRSFHVNNASSLYRCNGKNVAMRGFDSEGRVLCWKLSDKKCPTNYYMQGIDFDNANGLIVPVCSQWAYYYCPANYVIHYMNAKYLGQSSVPSGAFATGPTAAYPNIAITGPGVCVYKGKDQVSEVAGLCPSSYSSDGFGNCNFSGNRYEELLRAKVNP